jgi:phi13 family phage major tail protein
MANKVIFGLSSAYVAFLTESTGVFATPVALPGAVALTATPEGEATIFYADDVAYHTVTSNNGYKGTLEVALIPDTVLAEMLGWDVDDNGMLVEVVDGVVKPFALLGQFKGDAANRRFVYYKCTAGRPTVEHTTKGATTEAKTTTLPITITPIEIDEQYVVKGVIERSVANATVYDAFFGAVLEPSSAVS